MKLSSIGPLLLGLTTLVNSQVIFDQSIQVYDYKVGTESLIEFHRKLLEIESINPNEYEVAKYIEQFLTAKGLTVELQPIPDSNAYNVYSYMKSKNNKILLTSHIDTVPPYLPYYTEGSRIYGRGACDAKGSVASQVFAYLSMMESGQIKDGDVGLLFVVGEEVNGIGMAVANSLDAEWEIGIFGEPTEMKLGVGHKGTLAVHIEVKGVASHSGYPELGVSASNILIPVLNNLISTNYSVNELLGPTTLNVGTINAGVASNVVPAHAESSLLFRVSDSITELQEIVESKLRDVEHLEYTIKSAAPPQFLDYEVPGFESIILAYYTDVPNLHRNLTKKYLYGPGSIHVAHSDHEFVESKDLVDAIDGYKRLVLYSL